MILVTYKTCGCILEIPQHDAKEEIGRAADGAKCPRCRAYASDAGRALGSIRTPRKAVTSAENGKRGGRPTGARGASPRPRKGAASSTP